MAGEWSVEDEKNMATGLYSRLLRNRAAHLLEGTPDSALVRILFMHVASANYPGAAKAEGISYLPPQATLQQIWSATEAYVDKGIGSLDDLFQTIWGRGVKEYLKEYDDLKEAYEYVKEEENDPLQNWNFHGLDRIDPRMQEKLNRDLARYKEGGYVKEPIGARIAGFVVFWIFMLGLLCILGMLLKIGGCH